MARWQLVEGWSAGSVIGRIMGGHAIRLWPVTGLIIATLLSAASAMAETALSLYTAEYKTKVAGLSVTLARTLTEENGRYHITQGGKKAFMVQLSEDSYFSVEEDQIVGEQFVYQLSGVSNRRREVLFDEEAGTIRSLRKKVWTEHPWSPNVLDRLSQQEQMRLKLLLAETPPERISLSIVDGPKIKLKHFDLIETAVIETPVGALSTVHYRLIHEEPDERNSDTWLAVDHDFLMVRTEHVEKGSETVIQLESATRAGRAVIGQAP
jgi:hypothetical protein